MTPRFLLLFFGLAHSSALLSNNLQSIVNEKLIPSDLVKMKAVDPNWRGEGIFKRITNDAGLFVHRETNEIILETKEKLWTESDREIIDELEYAPCEFKNLIETKDWNRLLFASGYWNTNQFIKYWRKAMAEIVDMNEYDDDGKTVLMRAVYRGGMAYFEDPSVVKILLERGADVSAKDSDGRTALHLVAIYDGIEEMKLLLEFKAEINASDSDGWTALHYAVDYGRIEEMKLLLEFEADIDAIDKSEHTPLMWAVLNENDDAVKLLLERGARLDLQNKNKETALDIAKKYRYKTVSVIELLETKQNQIRSENV